MLRRPSGYNGLSCTSDDHLKASVKFVGDWAAICVCFVFVVFVCMVYVAFTDGE